MFKHGEGLALSSQLGASDSDANNLLPLMTEEKQCAGFNTGSESEPRSCVVGGPLSLENDNSSSGNGIERAGQHRSSVSRSRGAGGYVGSYGNAIDPIKMHAQQNLSVMHFLKPLHARTAVFSILNLDTRNRVILTRSIIDPRISLAVVDVQNV